MFYIFEKKFENSKFALSGTDFEIQVFLCFAIFAKNSKNQNGRHFWWGKIFSKIGSPTHQLPCVSKIASKSLYLARFFEIQAFLCFAFLKQVSQRCNKILKVKVTTTRSKVKSRSHHDAAHLHPLTNVPTKHQLPTPYSFRDIARTSFYRSRSLWQGQIKVRP